MPSLHIRDAATGVDLHILAGWTGVVGATRDDELAFLRLATGEPTSATVTVVREPDSAVVRRCPPRIEAIAAALAAAPDVLVVDDAAERVAAEARAGIVAALRDHRGVGLVALRDRALLDELTTAPVRVERGVPRLYAASYAAARATWQAEGEARSRERAAVAAVTRQQARLTEQAHHAALAASRSRAAAANAPSVRGYIPGRRTSRGK